MFSFDFSLFPKHLKDEAKEVFKSKRVINTLTCVDGWDLIKLFDMEIQTAKNRPMLRNIIWVDLIVEDEPAKLYTENELSVCNKILFKRLFGDKPYNWKLLRNKIKHVMQIFRIFVSMTLPVLPNYSRIPDINLRIDAMIDICKKCSIKNVPNIPIEYMEKLVKHNLVEDRVYYYNEIAKGYYKKYINNDISTKKYLLFIDNLLKNRKYSNIAKQQINKYYKELYHGYFISNYKTIAILIKFMKRSPLPGYLVRFVYVMAIKYSYAKGNDHDILIRKLRKNYDIKLTLKYGDNVYTECKNLYNVKTITNYILYSEKPGREELLIHLIKRGIEFIEKYIINCSFFLNNKDISIILYLVAIVRNSCNIIHIIMDSIIDENTLPFVKKLLNYTDITSNSIIRNTLSLKNLISNDSCNSPNFDIMIGINLIKPLIDHGAEITEEIISHDNNNKKLLRYAVNYYNALNKKRHISIVKYIDDSIKITDLAQLITNYVTAPIVLQRNT